MSEETKATEQKPGEIQEEMLSKNVPIELTEDDKKIAKKRAKKNNIPVEISEEARKQELNIARVKALTNEYNEKLNALGFILQAILKFSPAGIYPSFDIRPMNALEISQYNSKKIPVENPEVPLESNGKEPLPGQTNIPLTETPENA